MEEESVCTECSTGVDKAVAEFSAKNFDKVLCRSCQDKERSSKKVEQKIPEGVPKEYIIILQGKQFITHQGLLHVAHKKGLKSITTELLKLKIDDLGVIAMALFKATAVMKDDETFIGHGDATTKNVNVNIGPHLVRMAETRAVNRALRLATNIGMTSSEEMGEDVDTKG